MFDLGIQELIVIFIVALIVFGPKRLPELGRMLGKGVLELKKSLEGIKGQLNAESDTETGQTPAAPSAPAKAESSPAAASNALSEENEKKKENA